MSRDSEEDELPTRRSRRANKVNYNETTVADDDVIMEESSVGEDASPTEDEDEPLAMDEEEEEPAPRRQRGRKANARKPTATASRRTSSRSTKFQHSMAEPLDSLAAAAPSPASKSPARRHAQRRRSLQFQEQSDYEEEEEEVQEEEMSDDEEVDEEEESETEPIRIQRILASRSETKGTWKKLTEKMNTSEIDHGSRWYQESHDDDVYEERFLIKWADLSYLHVSWETQGDLIEQIDGAKTYLSTFFRKSHNGFLFTPDERCDGDYFDPAFIGVDRILEFGDAEGELILDPKDPNYEDGTGRQFLVKWGNSPYNQATYEFERDLILQEVDYKSHVEDFERRATKPTKAQQTAHLKQGTVEVRRLRAVFGEDSRLGEDARNKAVEKYQRELQEHVYKNGGQLRDYQTEGVAWMASNFINGRSSILADEMGLGKTLQTAIFASILLTKINVGGPVLVVVPLSTIQHWYREFASWTDLNAIVYHGSADDRRIIREYEMAYERDRPQGGISFNSLFLKKCGPRKFSKNESPWMFDVLITTPETLVADDFVELTAIKWELLVVDESHRLKNHNSKLAVNLRDSRFAFRHKLLLTGTPIQNSVEEFWSLLNVLDDEQFSNADEFMEQYGDMKSKESIDQLHEEIRPFILRRLKEDVEKSVPQKSETLIEVELTVQQKQYYRALYEKNVKFLHRNKKKALDGPGLNNLAMELRKCCNHLFLLNGVEEDIRQQQAESGITLTEGDFLAKASGKLVLLDKLLPRLKEEGHRVLIFSQFKIMLDILEDYLLARKMKFERIDGSITGNKRQQAIDRFQSPEVEGKELPFIMMLSTRAGGVGINLTAADTCIIFDSDFNPQNDLQAQARCHRIGQTKTVKVYRLLTRKTYEMQMFHMSSLKMGLDQAVLKGFESGSSSEGAMSKDEVEKLLRHGAYDIFNEDKSGAAEAESNAFVEQDIDSILERRSRTVLHENTGSNSNAAGGTFSKARFTSVSKTPNDKSSTKREEIDIEDPEFWKKMIGEADAADDANIETRPRQRTKANYSERDYQKQLEASLRIDYDSMSDSSEESEEKSGGEERSRWGGNLKTEWKKDDAEQIYRVMAAYGYGLKPWDDICSKLHLSKEYDTTEIKRMCWAIMLSTVVDSATDEVEQARRREERKKHQEESVETKDSEGGVLGGLGNGSKSAIDLEEEKEKEFAKLWGSISKWGGEVLSDAIDYGKEHEPRDKGTVESLFKTNKEKEALSMDMVNAKFAESIWPSLRGRGWTASQNTEEGGSGETRYTYRGQEFKTIEAVLSAAKSHHSELTSVIDVILESIETNRQKNMDSISREREAHLGMTLNNMDLLKAETFLERYGPLQLLCDRRKASQNKLRLGKRLLSVCNLLHTAHDIVRRVTKAESGELDFNRLEASLSVDKRSTLPHPMWTPRHDAVLVYAISKHGWVETDKCCHAMTGDETVKWGAPFESPATKEVVGRTSSSPELLATANRAATLLNGHNSSLHETKGFNFNLVVRTYGLVREGAAGQSPSSDKWVVDAGKLELSNDSGSTGEKGLAELPTKKDLVRRAKLVLSRVVDSSAETVNGKDIKKVSHDFAVLDQSERCNILLAELLRGILKTPATSKFLKTLCSSAVMEARMLADSTTSSPSATGDPARKPDAVMIAEQVQLMKQTFSKGTTQSKNLVRVMLGEDPVKPKRPGDELFPKAKPPLMPFRSTAAAARKRGSASSRNGRSVRPIGEGAILHAKKRQKEIYGDPKKLAALQKNASLLQLTEIETLILSELCRHGMPAWREDTDMLLREEKELKSSFDADFSWGDLGRQLEKDSQQDLRRARTKLERAKETQDACTADGQYLVHLLDLEKNVTKKDDVAAQASEYASEPETLAKKAIMLVAKIRQRWGAHPASHFTQRSTYNGLGSKVPAWQDGETTRWAKSLDLLDMAGRPLGFTAVDFMEDVSDEDRSKIQTVAIFDKQGSKDAFSQIAAVTKLRSLLVCNSGDEIDRKLRLAVKAIVDTRDVWEKEPSWWFPPPGSDAKVQCQHDTSLLINVLSWGLTDKLVEITLGSNPTDTGGKSPGLSKLDLQLRVNQLVRELSLTGEADASFRRLNDMQKEKSQDAKLQNTQQKGLDAFFSQKKTAPKSKVVDLVESPVSKKLVADGIEADVPGDSKRKQTGAVLLPASPGKKQRAS